MTAIVFRAFRKARTTVILACAVLLAGCGASSVEVQGSYPSPNIPVIPLTLGVYYDEALRDFVYTEYTDRGSEEYHIASGRSHMELFNTLLPAMFDSVVVLDSLEEASTQSVDAVFRPRIDEFQLALPQKTRLDVYEVWIRYNMRLTAPNGDYIADWVLTAYGKTPQSSMGSVRGGINDASVAALRDLGSNFTVSFTTVPDIRDWLQVRTATAAVTTQ